MFKSLTLLSTLFLFSACISSGSGGNDSRENRLLLKNNENNTQATYDRTRPMGENPDLNRAKLEYDELHSTKTNFQYGL